MIFLAVVIAALAAGWFAAFMHGQSLSRAGTPKPEAEKKIVDTGTGVAILVIVVALLIWPKGKPWYKNDFFMPIYKLTAQYLKPPAGPPPPGTTKAQLEATYVPIRAVLIGAVTCIFVGIGAGLVIKSTKDQMLGATRTAKPASKKGYASPWG
jgi:amino acid transporter